MQTLADWTVIVDVKNSKRIFVNNKEIDTQKSAVNRLAMTGKENKVLLYY
jgi:hypothetical protein